MRSLPLLAVTALALHTASAQIEPEMLMTLSSAEFSEGAMIPEEYTCDGRNVSPPVQFGRIPAAAKSLALIVTDPDAPGAIFTHWLVWNIETSRSEFSAGSVPGGVSEGKNDFGNSGYGGPCPPSGVHRYYFRLYALDTTLDLPAGATRDQVEAAMKGHVLKEAQLIGKYSRKK